MTTITAEYLKDVARIEYARSHGARSLQETVAWRAAERIVALERKLGREEVSHDNTVDQRDRAEAAADALAALIGEITLKDIGEHSSLHCPWENALEIGREYKANFANLITSRQADALEEASHDVVPQLERMANWLRCRADELRRQTQGGLS